MNYVIILCKFFPVKLSQTLKISFSQSSARCPLPLPVRGPPCRSSRRPAVRRPVLTTAKIHFCSGSGPCFFRWDLRHSLLENLSFGVKFKDVFTGTIHAPLISRQLSVWHPSCYSFLSQPLYSEMNCILYITKKKRLSRSFFTAHTPSAGPSARFSHAPR